MGGHRVDSIVNAGPAPVKPLAESYPNGSRRLQRADSRCATRPCPHWRRCWTAVTQRPIYHWRRRPPTGTQHVRRRLGPRGDRLVLQTTTAARTGSGRGRSPTTAGVPPVCLAALHRQPSSDRLGTPPLSREVDGRGIRDGRTVGLRLTREGRSDGSGVGT